MNNISNVSSNVQTSKLQPSQTEQSAKGESSGRDSGSAALVDRAEFTELGKLLALARDLPNVRAEKVAEVRAAIEDNEEKFVNDRLDGTVDRLIEDIVGP